MNILVTAALIGLAVYWGWLAAPKVKALFHKLNKKLSNESNNSETNNN